MMHMETVSYYTHTVDYCIHKIESLNKEKSYYITLESLEFGVEMLLQELMP